MDPKDSHILISEAYGCVPWYGEGDLVDVISLDPEIGCLSCSISMRPVRPKGSLQ